MSGHFCERIKDMCPVRCASYHNSEDTKSAETFKAMPDVDDTPPLDRALEAIEAVYQNHPNDKLTAFLILRYTVEERINDIKDESEASNGM